MSNIVSDLFLQRFGPVAAGHARSQEYRAGVMAALMYRAQEVAELKSPFEPGTAARDAFEAGVALGNALWTQHMLDRAIQKEMLLFADSRESKGRSAGNDQ
jgi:hypothetical protein